MSFVPGLAVFSKAGVLLGMIRSFTVSDPPTYLINDVGGMSFYVPRASADMNLLELDRIVLIGTALGGEPWVGTIDDIQYGHGQALVKCSGLLEHYRTAFVEMDDELPDNFPAAHVYSRIVWLVNQQKGAAGEIEWALGSSGPITKPYYGDVQIDSDGLAALQQVATRTDTEFRASAWVDQNGRLRPILLISDYFSAGNGQMIADGVHVVAGPQWGMESRPIRNHIELQGRRTNIADYVPEWARWAVHEFTPTVSAQKPPGNHRRRSDRTGRVDWGLSKKELRRLADLTMNTVWNLYRSYLRAVHDMDGRPFHPGWEFNGPPQNFPMLHTGRGWRNDLHLVERNGQPASMVMRSRSERQIAIVTFDRITGIQTFRRTWFQEGASQASVTHMSIHGWQWRYVVEAGVIKSRSRIAYNRSSATVTSYSTTYIWPTADPAKNEPKQVSLRRVVSLTEAGAVSEGHFFPNTMPGGPTNTAPFTSPFTAPYLTFSTKYMSHDVAQSTAFLSKMYEFERLRISEWHPARDGIGKELSVPTVWKEAVTTRPRWHVAPWGPGLGGTARLTQGVNTTNTRLDVDSTFDIPKVPFDAELGTGSAIEIVTVVKKVGGGALDVRRGRAGTKAISHEKGAPLRGLNIDSFDGFEFSYTWPEGSAWLQKLLNTASQPRVRIAITVANVNDLWADVRIGRRHRLRLYTEGPYGGGTDFFVRVIGLSPDADAGKMELLLEKVD